MLIVSVEAVRLKTCVERERRNKMRFFRNFEASIQFVCILKRETNHQRATLHLQPDCFKLNSTAALTVTSTEYLLLTHVISHR